LKFGDHPIWGTPLSPSLRLIRIIRIYTLAADILTGAYIVLTIGWQITTYVETGRWSGLAVSSALDMLNQIQGNDYATQATRGVRVAHEIGLVDTLFGLPAVAAMIVIVILLTAFDICLQCIEARKSAANAPSRAREKY
jgi:hypothetical protein